MPAARAFCARRAMSSSTFLPTIIIMSANSSMKTTMNGSVSSGRGASPSSALGLNSGSIIGWPASCGVLHLLVEAGQVAHAHRRHQLVAALHLGHAPAQAVGGLLHVGDDRRQQVRDALVDRKLQHLRVDHQHPHVLGGGLVQQRQHHRVDRDRLARTGGAGDQQVRHARQVRHGRPAGDVLAQRQRQRAGGLVVFLRAQQLGQEDHLARGVRRFQADHRLARDHVDHAHRLHRQAAGDVLVERTDLADLHARRGLQLEARDHRARIGADHLRIDAEILELEFDLPRQRFQRFLAVALGLRLGIVEQRQRRDAGAVADMEQRDLLLALGAVALLDDRCRRRLDLDRRALGAQFGVDLARFLALLAEGARLLPFGRLLAAAAEQLAQQRTQRERPLADLVHHRRATTGRWPASPRSATTRAGTGCRPSDRSRCRATCRPAGRGCRRCRAEKSAARADAQVQQAGGRHQETDDADQAQRRAEVGIAIAIRVHAEQRDPGDQRRASSGSRKAT